MTPHTPVAPPSRGGRAPRTNPKEKTRLRPRILLAILALAAPTALAQTNPELFVFRPGTPIKADEVNANFQLLLGHINATIGLTNLTMEDVERLAALVAQLQELSESGGLQGKGLEFAWDVTRLGIRREGEEEFAFVDLRGEPGPGLEFDWDDTRLGVRVAGTDDEFQYVDLRGPAGDPGPEGPPGSGGEVTMSIVYEEFTMPAGGLNETDVFTIACPEGTIQTDVMLDGGYDDWVYLGTLSMRPTSERETRIEIARSTVPIGFTAWAKCLSTGS